MDFAARNAVNLSVLKRHDEYIVEIIDTSSHVVVYLFDRDQSTWTKKGVEGTMFVFKRSIQPVFGFIVMNRLGLDNFMAPLVDNMDLEFKDEYIIYRTDDDVIHGIWIFEPKDRDRIGKSMKKCRELSLIITLPPQLSLNSSSKTTITTSKNQKTSEKQVDIINLLQKAEIKENNDHYILTNTPLYNTTTSNTIANNAASSSSTISSTFSYKPTSISNDRHSKDLLELFNIKTPPPPKRNIIDDLPRRYHTPPAITNVSTTPQNVLDGKLLLELLHQPTTTNLHSRSNSNSHSNLNHQLPLSSSSTSSSASSSLSTTNGTTKLSSNPTTSSTNPYFNYQQQRSLSPQNNNFSSMPVKSMLSSSSIQLRNAPRAPGLSSAPSTTAQSPVNHNNIIINNINYNPESLLLTNVKNPNNLSSNKNIIINDSISNNNNNSSSSSSNDVLKRNLALDISIPTLNKFINEYDSNGINNIRKRILTKQEFVQQYLQLIQRDPSFMDILYQNYVVKFQNT